MSVLLCEYLYLPNFNLVKRFIVNIAGIEGAVIVLAIVPEELFRLRLNACGLMSDHSLISCCANEKWISSEPFKIGAAADSPGQCEDWAEDGMDAFSPEFCGDGKAARPQQFPIPS